LSLHVVTLDFSQGPLPLYKQINSMYQLVETTEAVKIAVAAQYKQLNKQHFPCSLDTHLSMCLFLCRKQFIRKWCGCTPLDLSSSVQTLNECSVKHFISPTNPNCSKRIDQFILPECTIKCHPKCDRQKVTFNGREYNGDGNKTMMTIYIDNFDYPIFEEIPLLDARQVLGSIGGNLSLYLGANFMLLYYTAFYWMSAAIGTLMNKQGVAEEH